MSQFVSSLIGGSIAGCFALLAVFLKHKLEKCSTKKHCINALKIEIRENFSKLKVFSQNTEKSYIRLSDFSWNNYKHVVGDYYDKNTIDTLCEAYMFVGIINTMVNASFSQGPDVYKRSPSVITDAMKSLEKALNN